MYVTKIIEAFLRFLIVAFAVICSNLCPFLVVLVFFCTVYYKKNGISSLNIITLYSFWVIAWWILILQGTPMFFRKQKNYCNTLNIMLIIQHISSLFP